MIGSQMLGLNLMKYKDYSNRNDKMVLEIDKMYMCNFNIEVNLLQDEISLGQEC